MLKLWLVGIATTFKRAFCLHRRKVVHGEPTHADQEGGLYQKGFCKRCGKEVGLVYVGDDGMGHVFM